MHGGMPEGICALTTTTATAITISDLENMAVDFFFFGCGSGMDFMGIVKEEMEQVGRFQAVLI
jgi:hypothetical protein